MYTEVKSAQSFSLQSNLLKQIPTEREIIEMRANEGPSVNVVRAFNIYDAALSVVSQCTEAMPCNVRMGNASFLIGKAPWVG